ncbi:MAG: hypothetical protein A2Y40_08470 [Candidatus Margulisbacteria bacterium GWF2_35_9]|nr:MAG: hypothetical protein A2Y40_08470 [Candidatus Margulisbacteria bacterium GWF2_35_9]
MTKSYGAISRKELSGWGDSVSSLTKDIKVEDLSNLIDPALEETYRGEILIYIQNILQGLHLEDHTVIQRKYNVIEEDTVIVYEFLWKILLRRALKKLSNLISE